MSRDIFVQDIPAGIESVDDIADDWMPEPLSISQTDVREAVARHAPMADFTDPNWGHVTLPGADIEVSLDDNQPFMSFALHVRGSREAADPFIAAVLGQLGLRAFDPEADSGLFSQA